MKTCHIFCAAEFEGLLERPAPGDWILAADGGLRHLQALALEPTGILGDFDSLGYTPQGPQVDRFPVEKDDTDSMLAVKAGLRAGFRRFLLYGALDGPRLDHTVANLQADPKSLLVVVDTNRPDQVECKPLLDAISKVCVVDHHRRAADYINPVVVNLHEPYASSASELVTELLQYAVESSEVLQVEAMALLAGIVLDTKNFNVRTGERTFEAAAFLRRLGADTVEVKKLLQNDFQATLARYQIIKAARLYREQIAIAALNGSTSRTIAAQAADELLSIQGILTSFVLYPCEGQVIISARSIGEANVQVILEPLGGGGNAATAGAQLRDCDVKTALDRLVASIDQYYDA